MRERLRAGEQLAAVGPRSSLASLEFAVVLDRIGATSAALGRLNSTPYAAYGKSADGSWTRVYLGDDGAALKPAHDGIADNTADEKMKLLFGAMCAVLAANGAAIHWLQSDRKHETLTIGLLLRALAATNAMGVADDAIDSFAIRHGLEPWLVARVKADIRLEAQSEEVQRDGVRRLEELAGDPSLSPIHRAEVLFNLGLACVRSGDEVGARRRLEAALHENPVLEIARAKLEALRNAESTAR
jgi:hypothetical protein